MVESVTVFDEDWTEDDMAAALEWQTEDRLKCSGCGLPSDETMDPDRADSYDAEMVVCHACAAGDRTSTAFRQQDNPDVNGLRVRVFESD